MISKEELYELRITQKMGLKEIAKQLNCSQSWVCALQKRYGIKNSESVRNGETFGRLKIINNNYGIDKYSHAICLCKCECGNEIEVLRYSLIQNNTRSCGCLRNLSPYHMFVPRFWWGTLTRGAKVRNIELCITIDDVGRLYLKQNKRCNLSGLELIFGENWSETTASLDRIDSKKPYTIDNIQLVHKHVNRIKQHYNQQYFIHLCDLVSKHQNQNLVNN